MAGHGPNCGGSEEDSVGSKSSRQKGHQGRAKALPGYCLEIGCHKRKDDETVLLGINLNVFFKSHLQTFIKDPE